MIEIDNLRKCIGENPNFKIQEPLPKCPKPPHCDKTICPPNECEQRLYVIKEHPYGYFQIAVRFPNGEIYEESPSIQSLVRAGFKL